MKFRIPTNVVTVGMAGIILMASGGMGGAYAAKTLLTGADIKNGSITAKDLAKNSVKANQIANGSVRKEDLSRNSVTGSAIAPNSVTDSAIKDGSITTEALEGEASEAVETVIESVETGVPILGAGRLIYEATGNPYHPGFPAVTEQFERSVFTMTINSATVPGPYTMTVGDTPITCQVSSASDNAPGSCTATAVVNGSGMVDNTFPGGVVTATLIGIQVAGPQGE